MVEAMPRRDYRLLRLDVKGPNTPMSGVSGMFFMPSRAGQGIGKVGQGPQGFGAYSQNRGPLMFRPIRLLTRRKK